MSMYNLILVIINANVLSLMCGNVINCYNGSSCIGDKIVLTPNVYEIHGYGYKCLYGPITSINGTLGKDSWCSIFCIGAFSCDHISFMQSHSIICDASNSCSNINGSQYLYLSGTLYCGGSNSCKYSNLKGSGANVECTGDRSCNYAYFEGISDIFVRGAYGLFGAVFNSSGLTDNPSIYLFGYYAGFGASIICYPEVTCTINCFGNACYMLYIQCMDNCIINKDSNDTITPITNIADYNLSTLNTLSYNSEILTISTDVQCNMFTANVFDNGEDRMNGAEILINGDNQAPICCRGYYSCRNISNIQFNITPLDTRNFMVCSGQSSCRGTSIHNVNGSVFCDGLWSCWQANITAKNVYCLGHRSCRFATMYNVENVYCSGHNGCHDAIITTSGTYGDINIYLVGQISGERLQIYCNENDHCFILCGGWYACRFTEFYCNGACTIECAPDSGCPPSTNAPTNPTMSPSLSPSVSPSIAPSQPPSRAPSISPSISPSILPSIAPSVSPSIAPLKAPSNSASLSPSNIPTTQPINYTTNPTFNPTNAPLSEISEHWIVKDGGNCHDGYTDLNESNDHYGIYCMLCPTNTAGTAGNCFECDISKEPNHSRTECVEKEEEVAFYGTVEFQAIMSVIGLLTGCGCIGGFVCYFKRRVCQKNNVNGNIQQEMQTLQEGE